MTKKIIYGVLIIALIIAGVFVVKKISKKQETIETQSNSVNELNIIKEENTIVENENKVEESNIENETKQEKENIAKDQTPEEKAIEIVKENWGEDDTVYFFCEEKVKDGKYKRQISGCC